MWDNAPRWFLTVAIVAILAVLPLLISQERRMTVVETQITELKVASKEDSVRLLVVLDRLNEAVGKLNETVASLQTEVNYIKEH